MKNSSLFVAIVILIGTLWNSSNLVIAWQISPYDAFGWLALLLWISPLLYWILKTGSKSSYYVFPQPHSIWFLLISLFLSALGMLTWLNVIAQCALVFAIGAFMPWSWRLFLWLPAGICWMPVFGYLGSFFFSPVVVAFLRLLIAVLGGLSEYLKYQNQNAGK